MVKNIGLEYANAYKEVLEVLNHMTKEEYDKISKDMIDMFKNNCNHEHEFKYDLNKKFEEQDISERAKLILSMLFRDYWATPYQKEKIIEKQNNIRMQIEKEKQEKYNTNNIFEKINKKTIVEENSNKNEIDIIEHKESFFKKIINKIKSMFKR